MELSRADSFKFTDMASQSEAHGSAFSAAEVYMYIFSSDIVFILRLVKN